MDILWTRFQKDHPTTISVIDVQPELHTSVHVAYYNSLIDPLQQAICHTQINIGMTNLKHCGAFVGKVNTQLYEFCKMKNLKETHLDSWMKGDTETLSKKLIKERYSVVKQLYRKGLLVFDVNRLKIVERFGKLNFNITCPIIKYETFQNVVNIVPV